MMTRLLKRAYMLAVYAFLYAPIAILVVYSFNQSKYGMRWKGFSMRWYDKLAGNDALVHAALNSLFIAVCAASLATLFGTLAAVAIQRYRFKGRNLLRMSMYVLTVSPDLVMGISLLVLFVAMRIPLGAGTLLIAHTTFCLPFVVITVLGRLKGFDENLVEAARDLGAGEFTIFREVTLPLVLPSVVAGWLLSFTLSLDDVMVSFFVTGPGFEILPLKVYSMVRLGVKPEVNALCTILFGATIILTTIYHFISRERRSR
ncbi:MAG: spermidine/putrescine ABC transporter permease PotC [Desulfovibrio sp.]|uniref:spermidine/putrescine ABC transporter permease PotC n=1 Tax=Desulfovibrio sp. 7SRBS1 TaxID=3378064 RepID=UPI003B409BA8